MNATKESLKSLLYLISPLLFGFIATITFPDGALEIISYFYGNIDSTSEAGGSSDAFSARYFIFATLLTYFVLWAGIRLTRWWKRKKARLNFWKSLAVSLAFPILGYGYVISDVLNSVNVTTGMYLAVFKNNPEQLRRLLKVGGDPNRLLDNGNEHGHTLLMIAASKGHEEVVNVLLKHGANRHAKNSKGETALDFANEKGHHSISSILLSN
ncbi:ankyrin repeat domain-containing protein [Bdellovibrio bacteriovorus]|uniref:ankyrin repeat domain-containing protein n=1 Tax=Bdellovibrio bacteriovorus TaxID=959 RepID=UPI003AA913A5